MRYKCVSVSEESAKTIMQHAGQQKAIVDQLASSRTEGAAQVDMTDGSRLNRTQNVLIMGAAGRDFHNFNTNYRNNPRYNVVAFTATQIPNIDDRKYPAELAGKLYPDGIPIHPEAKLVDLIKEKNVDKVIFSYSDVPLEHVMHMQAVVNAAGAEFAMLGQKETQLPSDKPVISVCAVRTGCGKSQTSRMMIEMLMDEGLNVVAVRHPMPYGNLVDQKVQRFATLDDLVKHKCTIEEREEYEPHVVRGNVIYAGVDYEAILRAAEKDPKGSDVVIWDGGNNDFSFFKPDLAITVFDPLRPGNELTHYPSEVNLINSDIAIINKVNNASPENIQKVIDNIKKFNPNATIIQTNSVVTVDKPELIKDKNVLVVEDGPTLTHGNMKYGAGVVAAQNFGAKSMVNPRQYAVGEIADTYKKYPNIGESLLPAMGYSDQQLKDLETTINNTPCDTVVIGTPIDLASYIHIDKPTVRVGYSSEEKGEPQLPGIIKKFIQDHNLVQK